jgi:hypothetical protein
MAADLTTSLYSMVVVTYGTLATTSYLFNNIEGRARDGIKWIENCKQHACSYLWTNDIQSDRARANYKVEEEIRQEFERIKNKVKVQRWDAVQYMLYFSIVLPSILLTPLLLWKTGHIADNSFVMITSTNIMIFGQFLASISVPLVGINLFLMRNQVEAIDKYRDRLQTVSVGVSRPDLNPPEPPAKKPIQKKPVNGRQAVPKAA